MLSVLKVIWIVKNINMLLCSRKYGMIIYFSNTLTIDKRFIRFVQHYFISLLLTLTVMTC